MSTTIIRMTVKPECVARFTALLEDVTAKVQASEPDCLVYSTWHTAEPNVFLMVESYRTEAARALHNSIHAKIAPEFFTWLEKPPEVERLGDLLAGTPF
jgi:quinol monooxygenase YgiN